VSSESSSPATCASRRARTRDSANRSRGGSASRRRRYGTSSTSGRRGRALEIVLGANDFDGDTAERYGYVNRALPDAELDGFVDALARRIASFDRRAIAPRRISSTMSRAVRRPAPRRHHFFETALTWPETQQRIQALLKRGLQRTATSSFGGLQCSTHCSRRSHLVALRGREADPAAGAGDQRGLQPSPGIEKPLALSSLIRSCS